MVDVEECRKSAKECLKLANQTTDHVLRTRLLEIAEGWTRLAAELANTDEILAQHHDQQKKRVA